MITKIRSRLSILLALICLSIGVGYSQVVIYYSGDNSPCYNSYYDDYGNLVCGSAYYQGYGGGYYGGWGWNNGRRFHGQGFRSFRGVGFHGGGFHGGGFHGGGFHGGGHGRR